MKENKVKGELLSWKIDQKKSPRILPGETNSMKEKENVQQVTQTE